MTPTPRMRGFTLVELLVAGTIAIVAIAAAMLIVVQQGGALKQQAGVGSAISQSEGAFDAIERALRLAGTGMDPQFAFDFDFYRCQLPGTVASMGESANCVAGTRDSITAPDELVVNYRDPAYVATAPADARAGCSAGGASQYGGRVWGITAATAGTVTLVLKPGDTIFRGQVLQLVCKDGQTYTYATVSQARSDAPANSCSNPQLSLYPAAANDPFNQPDLLSSACFSAGTARAYAIRRQRFFIYRDLNVTPPRPYLMLDQGLDLDNNNLLDDADLLPIATDIEDLQVAYATEQVGILALQTPPTGWTTATFVTDSNADGVWGNDPGRAEQLSELANVAGTVPFNQFTAASARLQGGTAYRCSAYSKSGFYDYPCLFGVPPVEGSSSNNIHAYRWVAWSGGITQVVVGIVARSPGQDDSTVNRAEENAIPALLNRAAAAAPYPAWYGAILPDGHKRVTLMTSVHPVNMSPLVPFWN